MSDTRITLAVVACLTALAGCATSSVERVQEVEPGIYSVGIRRTFSQDTKATDEAVDKAGQYCHAKGQNISVLPGPSSDVRFRCIPSNEVAPINKADEQRVAH